MNRSESFTAKRLQSGLLAIMMLVFCSENFVTPGHLLSPYADPSQSPFTSAYADPSPNRILKIHLHPFNAGCYEPVNLIGKDEMTCIQKFLGTACSITVPGVPAVLDKD